MRENRQMMTGFLSDGVLYIFNSEHDLCLANGDPNFVPPASALSFSRECAGMSKLMCGTSKGWFCHVSEVDSGKIVKISPWGWDSVLRRRLSMLGMPDNVLPSADYIDNVRRLSHRRLSVEANSFIIAYLQAENGDLSRLWLPPCMPREFDDFRGVTDFVSACGDAVAKAPWSGSGHGLRWLRAGSLSSHDEGWCRNVISKQGSVVVERRRTVIQDFAMLFSIGDNDDVSFEGYSMFFCRNGSYIGNVLGSNSLIYNKISEYLPGHHIISVKAAIEAFLRKNLAGRYRGPLGVDMFIFKESGRYCLAPCVEINVRMTMGHVARHLYDVHLDGIEGHNCCPDPDIDGKYVMMVLHDRCYASLDATLLDAAVLPFPPCENAHFAVAVMPADRLRRF